MYIMDNKTTFIFVKIIKNIIKHIYVITLHNMQIYFFYQENFIFDSVNCFRIYKKSFDKFQLKYFLRSHFTLSICTINLCFLCKYDIINYIPI